MNKWTRRAFIGTGSVVGGGLLLGVGGLLVAPNRLNVLPENTEDAARLTTWVKITPDNRITAVVPHCEMGQGAHTTLAMMLADELDADWANVAVEEAPARSEFANGYPLFGFLPALANGPAPIARGIDYTAYRLMRFFDVQVTGGSSSTRGTGQFGMRSAGAAAKIMLIQAAAQRWNVAASECTAKASRVTHAGSNRSATYGELAVDAAKLDPPSRPALKERAAYTLMGTRVERLDIPGKTNGSAKYGIDAALPGMLVATISAAPVFGTTLASVDVRAAEAMPGVRKVVQLPEAVAVVADGYWRALQALRSLKPVFTPVEHAGVTTDTLFAAMAERSKTEDGSSVDSNGDAEKALQGAAKTVTAEYRVPFLAHAAMEPMNATVRIADGRCEVWTGVQDPLNARKVAADAAELDLEQVTVHNQQVGGGFGRRLPGTHDFIKQAVLVAKAVAPTPVKLIWSREEDIQHDYYRPAVLGQYQAALQPDNMPSAWLSRFNAGSDAAAKLPYAIEHRKIIAIDDAHHIRTGAWRSVASSQHGFFTESFIDELAHAAGKDPYEYRRSLLQHSPRYLAVLEKAASLGEWGKPLPEGRGRGIAIVEAFGTVVAHVAEVEVIDGKLRVHRIAAAVDCGEVVNPDGALAQVEGGVLFATSAALFEEITINEGRVAKTNFLDYPLAHMADAPRISVEFLRSDAPMGGLGEPGVPPVAPAIANALFAATGKRIRTLPLQPALEKELAKPTASS